MTWSPAQLINENFNFTARFLKKFHFKVATVKIEDQNLNRNEKLNVMRTVSRGLISNALRFSFSIPNILQLPISSVRTRSFGIRATKPKMGKNREEVENDNVIKSHPRVNKLQQLMHIESSGKS